MKRYNLNSTINYPDDELDDIWDFDSLDSLIEFIKSSIEEEHKATSFVFTIVAVKP